MNNDVLVELSNIRKDFGSKNVLNNFNLELNRNKVCCIVGASGSGKSSILKIVSCLEKQTAGSVEYNFSKDSQIPISYAFQESSLLPWLTIEKNLEICLNNSNSEQSIINLLKKERLLDYKDAYPYELSGGMQQKVNVIRSFINDSELILMDEPFGQLDFFQRKELQSFTLDLHKRFKNTIVFVTHNIHEALAMGDRIIVLSTKEGHILKDIEISSNSKINYELSDDYRTLYNIILNEISNDQKNC